MNQDGITTHIDTFSGMPLYLVPFFNDIQLATATGFIIKKNDSFYLITNWHVVSGRNADTNYPLSKTLAIPNKLRIIHHHKDKIGMWYIVEEPLYAEDVPLWLEHPMSTEERRIDVIALKLTNLPPEITQYPLDLTLADIDMLVSPAATVSIIGYPNGHRVDGAWPIWKTGHIATDFDINYEGFPIFLVDAICREGMSGSPVFMRSHGGYLKRNYDYAFGMITKFLGIYSGRIDGVVEIGKVWKPSVIQEILSQT